MKKLVLTGIGFFLALGLTFAQQVTPEESAVKVTTELTQKLSLTDEQKTSAYTISLEQAKAEAAVLADTTKAPDAVLASLNELQTAADTKVDALLTADQKELFKKVIAERPAKVAPEAKPVEEKKSEEGEKKSEENTSEQ